jgi:putative Mn2+ efflux pump MntP
MQLYEVILIGVALSMDACAVTIANCTTYKNEKHSKKELAMPIFFAIFQGLMPLIGFLIGSVFAGYISSVSKFITAGIFGALSIKMVIDLLKDNPCEVNGECKVCKPTLTIPIILAQALATSIDALAVGITFIDVAFSVYIAVAVISLVTLLLVSLALIFGKYLGKAFGKYAEWFGAGILIILTIKTLIEAIIQVV